MTNTTRKSKRPQPRAAAPAAAPEPVAPVTPAPPADPVLAAALEVLQLEALPASCAELAKAVGPAPPDWSWDQARAYSYIHRRLVDAAVEARIVRQQLREAPGET